MSYVKNTSYRDVPFSSETPSGEFYTYSSVAELAAKSEMYKERIFRCRTVGILQSQYGRFYVTDIDCPTITQNTPALCVSLAYLKSPVKSTIVPYPVQIFGTLQWRNKPVVSAKILQALTTSMAIRIRDAMESVTSLHLASESKCVYADENLNEENEDFIAELT